MRFKKALWVFILTIAGLMMTGRIAYAAAGRYASVPRIEVALDQPSRLPASRFRLEALDGSPAPSSMEMELLGGMHGTFPPLPISNVGTYLYAVTQVPGPDSDVVYDRSRYLVTVIATWNPGGGLHYDVIAVKDSSQGTSGKCAILFRNHIKEGDHSIASGSNGETARTGDDAPYVSGMVLLGVFLLLLARAAIEF